MSDYRVSRVTCNTEVSVSVGDFVCKAGLQQGCTHFPKARGFLKILGTGWVTWKFHNVNYKI